MIAMLLAAGRGVRMRPLTDHTPKPLLQAGGKPLIVWHIENLARAGIRDIVINHAHLGMQIENTLGDGSRYGVHIHYSPENPVLETAGGIANALPLLGDTTFAVINSDIYCDYDFTQLPQRAAALEERGDMAHLILVNNPSQHPNGDFSLHNGRVSDSTPAPLPPPCRGRVGEGVEIATVLPSNPHPTLPPARGKELLNSNEQAVFTFSGIGIYQPSLFASIPRGAIAPLAPLLRAQITHNKVSGELYAGRWVDVGTPQRLQELDNMLRATHNDSHGHL